MKHPDKYDDMAIVSGTDSELGNFLTGRGVLRPVSSQFSTTEDRGTGYSAARALLRQVDGIDSGFDNWSGTNLWPTASPWNHETWSPMDVPFDERNWNINRYGYDPRDLGRMFLASNGGSIYIDLGHLELATPEVRSAREHVGAWHGMLRIAQGALEDAAAELPADQQLHALVNNRDGLSNSYGSHVSFLISRDAFNGLFRRKFHHLLFLASYLASGILLTGTGKVGAENGTRPADFQISQRADFFDTLLGQQTTYDRPLINSRDESHAAGDMARLHIICFDNSLCHGTTFLKIGCTQLVLAMLQQNYVASALLLEDPVRSMQTWSRDPNLEATSRLMSGDSVRALDLQLAFHEHAKRFVAEGRAAGLVPDADEIVEYWGDTLSRLDTDPESLAGRLCWVCKRQLLEQARADEGFDWESPEIRMLDQLYHSLDPASGLYWEYEREGLIEQLVPEAEIQRHVAQPPENTRAYARAHLLRLAGPERVCHVDWDKVRVSVQGPYGQREQTVRFENPCAFTRNQTERIFAPDRPLEAIVADLIAMES